MEKLDSMVALFLLCMLTLLTLFNLIFIANYPWPTLRMKSHFPDRSTTLLSKKDEINLTILEFSTDKEIYSSFEDMYVRIVIFSESQLNNVSIQLIGIKPRQYAYVNDSKQITLLAGRNEVLFVEKTPYCTSGCGGVYPGPYQIEVRVYHRGKLIANSSKTIHLTSS